MKPLGVPRFAGHGCFSCSRAMAICPSSSRSSLRYLIRGLTDTWATPSITEIKWAFIRLVLLVKLYHRVCFNVPFQWHLDCYSVSIPLVAWKHGSNLSLSLLWPRMRWESWGVFTVCKNDRFMYRKRFSCP